MPVPSNNTSILKAETFENFRFGSSGILVAAGTGLCPCDPRVCRYRANPELLISLSRLFRAEEGAEVLLQPPARCPERVRNCGWHRLPGPTKRDILLLPFQGY